jgi:hypothetical protein
MKKLVILLVLAMVVAGGIFAQEQTEGSGETTSAAQEKEIKNWISGEVSILGAGARYERMLNDKMSIGANVYWTTLIFFADFEMGASFRYYVWKQLLFVGGGLGFHMHRGTYNYEYEYNGTKYTGDWFGEATGVALTPEVGFRIDVGNTGGFFLQPGLKIPITFGTVKFLLEGNQTLVGSRFRVGVGVVPYFGLGYAF